MIDWIACQKRLRKELSADEFDSKIRPLQPLRVEGKLVLYAPNRYLQDEVRRKYLPLIAESLGLSGKSPSRAIEIRVGELPLSSASGPEAAEERFDARDSGGPRGSRGPRPSSKGPRLNPDYSFKSFAVGDCNQSAHDAASEFATSFSGQFRLLVLIGPVGHGKTHLLHAIGQEILRQRSETVVELCHGQILLQRVVAAVNKGSDAVQRLVQSYKSADVLLFDDIKFIGRSPKTQEEFLAIFNALAAKGGRIVVVSDRHPHQIPGLDDGLRSRLGGGASVQINPLDQATAVSILRGQAKARKISLRRSLAERVVVELARSNGHEWEARQLEGAVQSLARMAGGKGGRVTMKQVDEYLRPLLPSLHRRVAVEEVVRAAAGYYGVKPSDIQGKRRYQLVVHARHMAMYLCKELTSQPYAYVGQAFGGKHHTTVKTACDKMEALLLNRPDMRAEYCNLRRKLLGK